MSDSTALVLSDGDVLQQICGVNDENLRILEQLFQAPILVRGNELLLDSENLRQKQLFVSLMSELEVHSRRGQAPSRGLIRALHSDLSSEDGRSLDALRRWSITIPVAGTKIFPRSVRQAKLLEDLTHRDLTFFVGPAGTGKTFLAVAHALQEVLSKRKHKLVLTRPVVEAGESLGYLPGDLTQKIAPYLRPLYDAIQALLPYETIHRLEEQNVIEVAPLAYMRGRSLRDSYVILDEAQNTTREQMKMFLTRLGENSRAVVTGDITQIDLPSRAKSGLIHAVRVLEHAHEIGITYLTHEDVVRSPLVQRIIQAYDDYRE
ncbi:MAG: PhoH family protein [Spirochaetales bacterium]|nr:PhoH family protein [Spirochaetales bacterium]